MTDSADMKIADLKSAGMALDQAVDSLEAALSPVLSRMNALESQLKDSDAFREDRVKLASELDRVSADAQAQAQKFESAAQDFEARAQSFEAREAEFDRLAAQTEAELERAITQFSQVMNG